MDWWGRAEEFLESEDWRERTGKIESRSQRKKALTLKFSCVWLPAGARSMGGSGGVKDKIIEEEVKKVGGQGGTGSSTQIWKSSSIMIGEMLVKDYALGAQIFKE